jgi:glycosyltransferase 2 family protein
MKKILRITAAVCLTAAAVWMSFRNIDLAELGRAFGGVNWLWTAAAAANTVFSVYALGWRWEILLRPQARISLRKLFRFNILSQTVNIAAPARMGEFVRAYLVSKESGASTAFVLGTILVERLLDVVVFAAVWIVTPALLAARGPFAQRSAWRALFVLPAAVLISFAFWPRLFQKAAAFVGMLLPSKARQRTARFVQESLEAFSALRRTKTSAVLVLWTSGLILSQILTNVFIFKAVRLPLGFGPALIVLLAVQAGSIPPSAPGKIGIFEYAVILALAIFGIARGAALTYGLILHVTVFLPKIVLGLIYLSRAERGWKTMPAAETVDQRESRAAHETR